VRRRNHRAAGMAVGNTKLEPGIMGQDPELRTQNPGAGVIPSMARTVGSS